MARMARVPRSRYPLFQSLIFPSRPDLGPIGGSDPAGAEFSTLGSGVEKVA